MSNETLVPAEEREQLRELYRMLQLGSPRLVGPLGDEMPLPVSIYDILKEVARNMLAGKAVSVVPRRELFTTQMAAVMLGCSRPHVIKLLESGDIPFQKIGMHRRVQYDDLLAYQRKRDEERHAALNALAQEMMSSGKYVGHPPEEGGSDE